MHSNLIIPVLPGDGIGPEITAVTLQVLERLGLGVQFEQHDVGHASLKKSGSTLPDTVIDAVKASEGFILGPVSHLDYPAGSRNPSGGLGPSGGRHLCAVATHALRRRGQVVKTTSMAGSDDLKKR